MIKLVPESFKSNEVFAALVDLEIKISDLIEKTFYVDCSFITNFKPIKLAIFVNSNDYFSIITLARDVVLDDKHIRILFEESCLNLPSYKKCYFNDENFNLVFICYHNYKGEPTLNINSVL